AALAARRRHRCHGQSRQSQRKSRARTHPRGRRQALLPAEILARPEPDRAGLRQAQASAAQGRRANPRSHLRRNRRNPPRLYARRMCQLLQKLRICPNLKSSGSSPMEFGRIIRVTSRDWKTALYVVAEQDAAKAEAILAANVE